MSRQKTLADREQYVVKANDLIRRTRYSLTAQQQKIVLFAISKIKPGDDAQTRYTFDINELANACGMKIRDGGYYYDRIKDDLNKLASPEWVRMTIDNGKVVDRMISWINSDAEISPGDSTVTISFNRHLQPYLFELKEKYTQYRLQNVLAFRGKYAIRLYEIMRSYTTQSAIAKGEESEIDIPLEQLRDLLDTDAYDRWVDFNRFILKPAITEINERAEDIHIDYHPMRAEHARTIERINFVITSAGIRQQTKAHVARKKKLDHLNIGGETKK